MCICDVLVYTIVDDHLHYRLQSWTIHYKNIYIYFALYFLKSIINQSIVENFKVRTISSPLIRGSVTVDGYVDMRREPTLYCSHKS